MQKQQHPHSFHIPVMGLAFTLDSPIKVAKYGISSVISIVDDVIIEKMNEYYSNKFKIPYSTISTKVEDYRAKRITSYLNTVDTIVKHKFENLKKSYETKSNEFEKYMEMLPDFSELKQNFIKTIQNNPLKEEVHNWIQNNLKPGNIDVNIMTKLDKANFKGNEKLPTEFNDAHAALRGFANSNLESSIVLSAGMNPRLYSYFENFNDFFPDENGLLKKKIILKVSDYRSALIQGKFLAKKGLWVSEYRIESGLNCGGHAFASDGYLLGPILEEFKNHKEALISDVHQIFIAALESKEKTIPSNPLKLDITVQGGVGNSKEHEFLLDNYNIDSVGWGSPFLLVPEATTVDSDSIEKLKKATEKDLFLSNVSPLGVPFNSLKDSSNDLIKNNRILNEKPGSSCPKKFLALSLDAKGKPLCTASKKYQTAQLEELSTQNLDSITFEKKSKLITDKTCLCEGLANAAIINYNMQHKGEDQGVAICPGPNAAYFSRELSLKQMVSHIYGKTNVITTANRPHFFIKELSMYVDYFSNKVDEFQDSFTKKQEKYLTNFKNNLNDGIAYYQQLFSDTINNFEVSNDNLLLELEQLRKELIEIKIPVLQAV
ncbi:MULTISPECIES: hypothetical protein [Flavobacteriaceae]|uniref:Uncharacterized protein n=2 Tax=Flavobacteriaceae TaxID=49546 RepID=A0A4Y8AQV9_9FLAO|nr:MULTISPECIES: hypothetical protein [Flavobacteriaceae]TEW73131.1 hypothetical protein E2488_13150 [Gramella jeungdoensis]GGK46789.1 hypothetical protein GCM10007963_13840 [Lutibacter litoralis]